MDCQLSNVLEKLAAAEVGSDSVRAKLPPRPNASSLMGTAAGLGGDAMAYERAPEYTRHVQGMREQLQSRWWRLSSKHYIDIDMYVVL